MPKIELIQGDCIEQMKTLADNSIDAIITDPPYGTTGVAAVNTNRNAILIERDPDYCEIIRARINEAKPERTPFDD